LRIGLMASAVVFVVLPSQAWEYRQGGLRKGFVNRVVSRCRSGKLLSVGERSLWVENAICTAFPSLPDCPVARCGHDQGYATACELPTIPSTLVPHWAEVRRSVPRLRSALELHIAASARGRVARDTSTHSRNGIPYPLNVYRRPSRAFYGHPRSAGVSPLRPAHLGTRRCWIASMEETRFPSSARSSKQGSRRCRKEIGCKEVWW
jgi:hypothetical protein